MAFGILNTPTQIGINGDVMLHRDAANTLAMRNGANAQAFNIYNTYTDASNYERATIAWSGNILDVGNIALGTGTQRQMRLVGSSVTIRPSGTSAWQFNTSGHLLALTDNTYDIGASGNRVKDIWAGGLVVSYNQFYLANMARIIGVSDGVVLLRNTANTDFNRLQFGGTSSSFPAIKRYNNSLQLKLADDSDYTALMVGNLRYNVRKVSANTTGLYNDSIIHCNTGVTITLPPANTATGMNLIIKDVSGSANQVNIVVQASGSQLIDGAASKTINKNYTSLSLYSDGDSIWSILYSGNS